jgi:hypothetical protein
MPSSGVLSRVALVRINVSEELIASISRVTIIYEIGTTLAVTKNRSTLPILVTLKMEVILSSKKLVLTKSTWCNIPEDGILHLKFYL